MGHSDPLGMLLTWSRELVAALKRHPLLLLALAAAMVIFALCFQAAMLGSFGPPSPWYFAFDVIGLVIISRTVARAMAGSQTNRTSGAPFVTLLMLVVILMGAVCSGTKVHVETLDPAQLLQGGHTLPSASPINKVARGGDMQEGYTTRGSTGGLPDQRMTERGIRYRVRSCADPTYVSYNVFGTGDEFLAAAGTVNRTNASVAVTLRVFVNGRLALSTPLQSDGELVQVALPVSGADHLTVVTQAYDPLCQGSAVVYWTKPSLAYGRETEANPLLSGSPPSG